MRKHGLVRWETTAKCAKPLTGQTCSVCQGVLYVLELFALYQSGRSGQASLAWLSKCSRSQVGCKAWAAILPSVHTHTAYKGVQTAHVLRKALPAVKSAHCRAAMGVGHAAVEVKEEVSRQIYGTTCVQCYTGEESLRLMRARARLRAGAARWWVAWERPWERKAAACWQKYLPYEDNVLEPVGGMWETALE